MQPSVKFVAQATFKDGSTRRLVYGDEAAARAAFRGFIAGRKPIAGRLAAFVQRVETSDSGVEFTTLVQGGA